MKKFYSLLISFITLASFQGIQAIDVSSITISEATNTYAITTNGGSLQLNATVLPDNASDKSITWRVVSGDQATITQTGLLTAVANGRVCVRAFANDGTGIYSDVLITITGQSTPVSSITVSGENGVTAITTNNGTLQMISTVLPADATDNTVTWSVVSGNAFASISASGMLTALANGTVTVRATANDGSGVFGEKEISISNQIIPVSSITVAGEDDATEINTDNGTLQMTTTVLPADATDNTVTWSVVSGNAFASISASGMLTALANGTVTVRATANDGSGAFGEKDITISGQIIPVSSITVAGEDDATEINSDNGTLQMTTTVLPADATDNTVTWSVVSGNAFASISTSGMLTALANGTVTVRATANDGSGVYDEKDITISGQIIPVSEIVVSTETNIKTITTDGGTLQLSAKILPENATVKEITWSVENISGKAIISNNGLLTALENGNIVAKATSNDNSGVYGTAEITISGQVTPVEEIIVISDDGSNTINTPNGTLQLLAKILPDNATNTNVVWSVENVSGKATIDSNGLLTAIADGNVVAKASATDNSQVYGTMEISITGQIIYVTKIKVTGEEEATAITTDGGTLQMHATIFPDNATSKEVTWSVTDQTGRASIDKHGLLTASSNGTVLVTASSTDNSNTFGTMEVNITGQITKVSEISIISENNASAITTDNGTLQMQARVSPDNATDKTVTWSVSKGIAIIDIKGLLTAVTNGMVTVRATANDGSGVFGEKEISISNQIIPVSSITVAGEDDATEINTDNGTLQMTTTVLPANATDNTVTWSVINGTGAATIDKKGLLTAASNGTVTVKATAHDGSGVFGEMEITIGGQSVVGINDIETASLAVYPNPFTEQITIQSQAGSIIKNVSIITLNGQPVLQRDLNDTEVRLPLTDLKKGVYILKLVTDSGAIVNKKIIKK